MSLFSSVKDGLKKGIDASTSVLARQFLQEKLEPYGQLNDLTIDSAEKRIRMLVRLKGETEDTELVVERYTFVREGDRTFVVVCDVRTSREWMSRLAGDFLVGQRFELPAKYATLIEKVL